MKINKIILTKILTYLGAIPFIFLSYLNFINYQNIFSLNTSFIVLAYGAIILSFISGIHFCYAILQDKFSQELLVLSNIIALISWLSLLLNSVLGITILIFALFVNLLIDYKACKLGIIPNWFFSLRLRITLIVIISLTLNY